MLVAVGTDPRVLTLPTPPGETGDGWFGNCSASASPWGMAAHAAFFRDQGAACQAGARPHHRRVGGMRTATRLTACRVADARTAHSSREGDLEHLHRKVRCSPNIAGLYAVYHGPQGLTRIAERVHGLTRLLSAARNRGLRQLNACKAFLDTIRISGANQTTVRLVAEASSATLSAIGTTAQHQHRAGRRATADDAARIVEIFDGNGVESFVRVPLRRSDSPTRRTWRARRPS